MSQNSLVLATGVNGYLGAHVVDQLVKAGYRVRGTVRASKLESSKRNFASYGDAVEIVVADDLINGSFPEIFDGVDAVVHTAAPLVGREATPEAALNVSIEGSLNVLRQAEKAGIKNFSYASSIVAHSDGLFRGDTTKVTEDQWLPITRDAVLSNSNIDPFTVYAAEKALSEKAVWEFVDAHPHVELASINPTFFYGPFAPGHKSPFDGDAFSASTISTMAFFYKLIKPDEDLLPLWWIDVRDVARSLVAALKAPSTAQIGRKRLLISSEYHHASELADLVRKERPQLADRVNKQAESAPQLKQIVFNERFKEVLGFELVPWKQTILDGVDTIVALEEYWKAQGKPIA